VFQRNAAGEWAVATELASPPERFASITGTEIKCSEEGEIAQFGCQDVELLSFLSVGDIGGERGVRMNDVWGWTDPDTNREYVIAGRVDGTAFVDITDPLNPVYLGNLAKTEGSPGAAWRDMKVYQNHAYIVADASQAHGVQVFDLTRLRNVQNAPVEFTMDARYDRVNSVHNIVINEETGFAYAVGSSSGGETCGGGLHMIDIREPKNPTFAGCFSDALTGRSGTGYTHDAQCVVYRGPDPRYQGKEICFNANETALSIADVSDKSAPIAVSRAAYPNVAYSHQGWLDEEQRYFYMNDELDELSGLAERTRTIIWDVSDLEDPRVVGEHLGTTGASDHNLYIIGDLMYQSNYQSGLRILDISDRLNPREVAFFDTVPYGTNTAGFGGSWSNYPYFPSGSIAVTSGGEGLFIVKKRPSGVPVSQEEMDH
jgi:choice-of-anchor B domain-containing protein